MPGRGGAHRAQRPAGDPEPRSWWPPAALRSRTGGTGPAGTAAASATAAGAEPGPVARGLRLVAAPAAAVAAVAGIIAILVLLNGHDTNGAGPVVAAGPSPHASAAGTAAGPPASAPASPAPATTRRSPRPAPTTPAAATAEYPPLTVLNNSRIQGLAARGAAMFAAAGWRIAVVGDFDGRLPETTVYYGPGQLAAARALAAQFPRIQRLLPRFPGLVGPGLVVVLTRYFVEPD